MNQNEKIARNIYLNPAKRVNQPFNFFSNEEIREIKCLFYSLYKDEVLKRAKIFVYNDKEKAILRYLFDWAVSSTNFQGDVLKGLYIASPQGFGKDVLLNTVSRFFSFYGKIFEKYTFPEFNLAWYSKHQSAFAAPTKINDINEQGRIKRERFSIPFLELLDFRDQTNNRRSMIVSTNFGAQKLQESLEFDSPNPRLAERIKECFNVIVVNDVESKRVENIITI